MIVFSYNLRLIYDYYHLCNIGSRIWGGSERHLSLNRNLYVLYVSTTILQVML